MTTLNCLSEELRVCAGMNIKKLNVVIAETEVFLRKAKHLRTTLTLDETDVRNRKARGEVHVFTQSFPKESGATRRASLDLTRALAELRKPS